MTHKQLNQFPNELLLQSSCSSESQMFSATNEVQFLNKRLLLDGSFK